MTDERTAIAPDDRDKTPVPHRHGVDTHTDVTATSPPLAEQSGVDTNGQHAETTTIPASSRHLVDLVDNLYLQGDTLGLTMMATALDATEKALARPTNVVPLHGHSVKR